MSISSLKESEKSKFSGQSAAQMKSQQSKDRDELTFGGASAEQAQQQMKPTQRETEQPGREKQEHEYTPEKQEREYKPEKLHYSAHGHARAAEESEHRGGNITQGQMIEQGKQGTGKEQEFGKMLGQDAGVSTYDMASMGRTGSGPPIRQDERQLNPAIEKGMDEAAEREKE